MPPTYRCGECPLLGGQTHYVPKREGARHRAEIVKYREQQMEAEKEAEKEAAELADVFTGLVITDDGPDVRGQQHSRLFSSREDYQATVPEVPRQFQPLQTADALASAHAVARAAPTRQPVQGPQQRRERWVAETLEHVRKAHAALDHIYQSLIGGENEQSVVHAENNAGNEDAAQLALDSAAKVVSRAGRVLKDIEPTVRTRQPALKSLWEETWKEAEQLDTLVTLVGSVIGLEANDQLDEVDEAEVYDTEHHFHNPIENFNIVSQLAILVAIIANVIMRIGREPCNFLMDTVVLIVKATMSLSLPPDSEYTAEQQHVLKEIPQTMETALKAFRLDPKTRIFAACPSCHHTHDPLKVNRLTGAATYPTHCTNMIFPAHNKEAEAVLCGTALLEMRQGKQRPIKPFVFPEFTDYLASVLSDPEIVATCNNACDKAWEAVRSAMATDPQGRRSPEHVNSVFEAEFLRNFQGPVPEQLFINRDGRMRLAFEILLDFFNPHGLRKRGNHDSIGILAVVNLNLPEEIRYTVDYMWISIILGPKEPNHDQIGSYLRPLIDTFVQGWKHGIHFSRVGGRDEGCIVDIALVINVNDLPATRKIIGFAGVGSNNTCNVCKCKGAKNVHRTDLNHPDWQHRDVQEMREHAYAWKNAKTQKERDEIFEAHGVRWSELWRLPYWNPTKMAVVDSMHCILEGLVHYHCRRVLRIDAEVAKKKESPGTAFDLDWVEYDPTDCPNGYLLNKEKEIKQIRRIQNKLMQSLGDHDEVADELDNAMSEAPDGDGALDLAITEKTMRKALLRNNLPALRFVAYSLGLSLEGAKTKADYTDRLMTWRLTKPRVRAADDAFVPKAINMQQIKFIQHVIAETEIPAWVNTVPHNYGESSAGTIKADEWRTLSTIYLPIALVLLWGDRANDQHSDRLIGMLDHSMALFSAVTLVCRYTMTEERARFYRDMLKMWVEGLPVHHPHTEKHAKRPNVHVAFHLYDFLLLFGPVLSWWCFPFERMIGYLQGINTNNRIGGQLEGTLTMSFFRGASLRRWLRRSDCPELLKQFNAIFKRAFPAHGEARTSPPRANDGDRAHYRFNGVNFSRASAHLGNSIIMYYPTPGSDPIVGSIEEIHTRGERTSFVIRRQAPLAAEQTDPFARFRPHISAYTYSSKMQDRTDTVDPSCILSHCARYEFSGERAVVLNLSRS